MQAERFTRIFESSPASVESLHFADLDQLEQEAGSSEIAAWQALLASMALRRAGHRSPANEWLNHAMRTPMDDDVFRAEMLGEAGQGLYESDRLQDALGILDTALAIWRSACDEAMTARASAPDAAGFAARLRPLLGAGHADADDDDVDPRSLVSQWLVQRAVQGRAETAAGFIRVLARRGSIEEGRQLCTHEVEWTTRTFPAPVRTDLVSQSWADALERQVPRPVLRALYALYLAWGELELAANEYEASAQRFADAAGVYDNNVTDYSDIGRLLRARFNQANSLLRLHRFDEALSIFELCEHGFSSIRDEGAAQRVAHAKLYAQTAAAQRSATDADVRQLVIDGEAAAREAADPVQAKAALLPQYGMYLNVLSKGSATLADRAEDFLRVIGAMREEAFANLEIAPRADDASLERIAGSPLRVLAGYMARLPDTAVLMIETGASSLVLFALRGGDVPFGERIVLERASPDFIDALVGLMGQQRDDLDRIAHRESVDSTLFDPIERAAAAVWTTMPATVRAAIDGARTLLYMPGAFGDLSTFPLELVRGDDGWLGVTHSIARLSSMRTLFELLSPNRMPAWREARALIVRAEDSEELAGADAEVMAVHEKLDSLHMDVRVDLSPTIAGLRDAFNGGLSVLHYCGHGLAGPLGEALPLNANELIGPHEFSQLSGSSTPFVYLSTCEVGRARMTTTGSAAGFSTRLIEKGAPGVIGCLESVPDAVAQAMANAFYHAAASRPLGEALSQARAELEHFPPSCRGAFACFGDPSFDLHATGIAMSGIRQRTTRWDSLIGRHVAFRSQESRDLVLHALDPDLVSETAGDAAGETLDAVADWIETSFRAEEPAILEERLVLCRYVALSDAVAGCQLRMLLAMELLHGSYHGELKPDIVAAPEELAVGLYCARAVHDTIAWPAFVIEAALSGAGGYDPLTMLRMLDEAAGMLDGWARVEHMAAGMLSVVHRCRANLSRDALSIQEGPPFSKV